MRDLAWSLRTIQEIDTFLSARSPRATRSVLAEIKRTCGLLAEFPMIGVRVSTTQLRAHVTRRYRYRIIYRISDETIEIRDILHPSRNR